MNDNGPLTEVITAYLQAVDAGQPPDRDELLARHPDLTAELRRFFATQDRLDEMAGPLRPEPPAVPRRFGDYEVLGEIGRGGMGVVYRARQVSLGREVAVKVLAGGNPSAREDRLRHEAEVLARLDHPGIVPIYEVGVCDERAFFAMKLIEGTSLADRFGSLRADLPRAVRLLAAVARAVQYAHDRGVVHRDLKPANILLDAADAPFVTDFGLALRLDSDARLTASGAVVGTPAYMAPEQAESEREIGPAADVWALGVILYELLAGRAPFTGATPLETLHRVMRAAPPPLGAEVRGWARELEGVCLRCMQRDPARRYASAGELADDLERWLRRERPQGAARPRWRLPVPGRRAVVAALVVGAVALLAFDRDRIARRNVARAAYALDRGEVRLAREALEAGWTPRWLLCPSTRGLLDDATRQTEGYCGELGADLELDSACFSTTGHLVRLRRPDRQAILAWERWRETNGRKELGVPDKLDEAEKGVKLTEERKKELEAYRKMRDEQHAELRRQMAALPPEYTFHYFDTRTRQECRDKDLSRLVFEPSGEGAGVGVQRLPRYCLQGARHSPDGKVLITRTRRQGRESIGLWKFP